MTIQDENKIRKSIENLKASYFQSILNHDITNTFPATRVQALAQLHHKSIVKSDHVTTLPINSIRQSDEKFYHVTKPLRNSKNGRHTTSSNII